MYLPRSLISKLYTHLQTTRHALSQPVLLLVALEPDALCACRILTRLLKHDYIPHKIQPVAGYADLERAARELVQPMMETRGGSGGVVICLGVGGMVDLGALLGLEPSDEGGGGGGEGQEMYGGVEVWLLDSHRPWNLSNVFGGVPVEPKSTAPPSSSWQERIPAGVSGGRIERAYRPGKGGIVVFDDGDIEEDLVREQEAYTALVEMPEVEDDGESLGSDSSSEGEGEEGDGGEDESGEGGLRGRKRKTWMDGDSDDDEEEEDRPRQRRRSNSVGRETQRG
jgi:cell division control protein 45